jgi:hypothetical protein
MQNARKHLLERRPLSDERNDRTAANSRDRIQAQGKRVERAW